MNAGYETSFPTREPDLVAAIQACARGDRAGLRELYEQLGPRMTGVALRMLRRRDLADEVVHDTFVRVWENAGSYDARRGEPQSWIFAILRHRALSVLRSEGRVDLVGDVSTLETVDEGADAEAALAALSERGALRRCLDRLEPQRRQAIILAYIKGLTHGELAGRLGVPLGTAKAWIRRSLQALRECMA